MKNEKVFGLELYAILGFFERKMRDMSSFMNSLGNMKSAFQPTGEIVNMLMTSKRFTDQLDDILIDNQKIYVKDLSFFTEEQSMDIKFGDGNFLSLET